MHSRLRVEHGHRLRRCREQAGKSLGQVAREVGTDKAYLSRIEAGQVGARGPSDDMKMRIAAAVNSRVEDVWQYPDPSITEAS